MRRAAALAVGLVLLAGCGGGDEADPASPPAAASPASTAEQPEASAAQGTTVDIEDFTFAPGDVTVASGEEVTWVNADASNHNVVFDDEAQEGIPNLREAQEDSVKFSKTGSFAYVCSYHPGMKGTVVVE